MCLFKNPGKMPTDYGTDESSFCVTVKSPTLHTSWEDGQYTSYLIHLETSNIAFQFHYSDVRRRYSEFVRLRKLLKNQHPTLNPPDLPSKFLFANKLSPDFIEQRRKGLQTFLEVALCTPLYLSNRSLHLFMQSSMPMDQIECIVCGTFGKQIKSEPHLSMNTRLINDFFRNTSEDTQNSDRTDGANVETLGLPKSACNKYGNLEQHSHVTMGSRITLCSPNLQVPGVSDQDLEKTHQETRSTGSSDSDCSSPTENSSPNSSPAWDKCTLLHGILNSRSSSQNSSLHSSPSRKKKVSFHSEVTVAHLFS